MKKWVKKQKGHAVIYIHPDIDGAIVNRMGLGIGPNITWRGKPFNSIKKAKEHATLHELKTPAMKYRE